MATLPVRRANILRLAVGGVAFASGLGALAVALGPGAFQTYAGLSNLAAVFAMAAGLGLVVAGVVTSLARRAVRIGDLALLAGFIWFAPFWVGWADGPPLLRGIATAAAGFVFALLVHLVLAYPSGRLRSTVARALVTAMYLEATLSALGRALFRNPLSDQNCWDNCADNVFLVHSYPRLARGIVQVDRWFIVGAACALAIVCVWRLVTASGPARRVLLPVGVSGIVFAAATAAHSIALLLSPLEEPTDPAFLAIFVVGGAAVILLAASLLWAAIRARIQRRSVARIVTDLGEAPSPGSLESALGRAVGDPELRIAYWLPASSRYVDAHGRQVPEPAATPGHAATQLVRDGRRVAVVMHAAAVPDLEREMGAAVQLAIENERLQAEVLSQLEDLRASRARVVETGDAARRRLERDLHDGAQQRLLALSYDLRLARSSADADGDPDTASLLAAATDDTLKALAELRELAHGIYPAILTEAGLAPALETLADTALLPVQIDGAPEERYPALVENAAYLVVTEGLEDAGGRGATLARISAVREDGNLVVSVDDDGGERTSSMVQVADRVGALGGTLDVGPLTLRAQIPCE